MRLIDEDELRKVMYHEAFETDSDMQKWDGGCWIRYKMFEKAIDSVQTIEAEPVRHGRWLHDDNFYYETRFVCSECKESECVPAIGFAPQKPLWDYCPNCGAKMDGGDKNAIS